MLSQNTKFIFCLVALLWMVGATKGQQVPVSPPLPDTAILAELTAHPAPESPYYAIGLGVLLISFAAAVMGVFLFLLVTTAFIVGLAACAVGLSIISVSTLHALHKQSLAAGLHTFTRLSCAAAGMALGAATTSLLARLFHWLGQTWVHMSIGVAAGLIGGLLGAAAIIKIAKWVSTRLVNW